MIRQFQFFTIASLIFCLSLEAHAGVTTIQQLRFGEFIVRDNNSVHTITVNPGGVYSFSPGFIEINPTAQDGVYDLDGMVGMAGMAVASVVLTQVTPLSGGGGPNFQMNTFQVTHPPTIDGAGVLRVTIGATAQTSGTGVAYFDQTYTGQINIQVNF